jgi:hypothetical protein
VTIETTLEAAVADTSSEDPVVEDTSAVSEDAAETENQHPEGANDDDSLADVPEVTPTMADAEMAGDSTANEVSSITESLLCFLHRSIFIHPF